LKIFICSDIHGNIRAFEAVLALRKDHEPCKILFLGDVVGYGAHPDECLDLLLDLPRATLILGNHEWALLDEDERRFLNKYAYEAISWSRKKLKRRYDSRFNDDFELVVNRPEYIAAHASPYQALDWPYIYSASGADPLFRNLDFNTCFIGHTHIPLVYTYNKGFERIEPGAAIKLDTEKRYLINPGSVGQPRDRDARASCCIWDMEDSTLTFLRCEYDVEAEANDIRRAGLPAFLADRLLSGE
jgi:predicted phosphodiesterase